MSTPHLRNCPKVNCNQKNDCCPFRKIVIPAVMGDDSEDSPSAPENGAYRNALVEYEANGAMYIYASDGIWTKMSMVAGGHGAATVAYVDNQDAAMLAEAKAYADTVIPQTDVSKEYVDDQDAIMLNDAKNYTDSVAYLTLGNQMTIASPEGGTSTSISFNTNNNSITMSNSVGDSVTTPTKTSDLVNDGSDNTSTYVEASALATVATSGSYNDLVDRPSIPTGQVQSDWAQQNSVEPDFIKNKPALSAVATSGSYTDLSNQPAIPTIIMQTTDPGEGSTLADNTFIGVYS